MKNQLEEKSTIAVGSTNLHARKNRAANETDLKANISEPDAGTASH